MFDIAVITSHHFSSEEFTQIVTDMGATHHEDDMFFIPGKEGFIYATLDDSTLKIIYKEQEQLEFITKALEHPPMSAIVVSMTDKDGSEEAEVMALTFVLRIAEQWGAVVDNSQPNEAHYIYTLPELKEMEQRKGRWFSSFHYIKDIM